jgi:hypothetical protein
MILFHCVKHVLTFALRNNNSILKFLVNACDELYLFTFFLCIYISFIKLFCTFFVIFHIKKKNYIVHFILFFFFRDLI